MVIGILWLLGHECCVCQKVVKYREVLGQPVPLLVSIQTEKKIVCSIALKKLPKIVLKN